jgi:hypothetical protein
MKTLMDQKSYEKMMWKFNADKDLILAERLKADKKSFECDKKLEQLRINAIIDNEMLSFPDWKFISFGCFNEDIITNVDQWDSLVFQANDLTIDYCTSYAGFSKYWVEISGILNETCKIIELSNKMRLYTTDNGCVYLSIRKSTLHKIISQYKLKIMSDSLNDGMKNIDSKITHLQIIIDNLKPRKVLLQGLIKEIKDDN